MKDHPMPPGKIDNEEGLQRVCDSIRRGRCVAFVGAGFSAAAVPAWPALLLRLAAHECIPAADRRDIRERLLEPTVAAARAGKTNNSARTPTTGRRSFRTLGALELEGIAQVLRDSFESASAWEAAVLDAVRTGASAGRRKAVYDRVRVLRQIPFRAILTTNFDDFLPGEAPSGELYRRILREDHPWWNRNDRNFKRLPESPIVKLHGDANGAESNPVVLQRAMYRDRLYGDPSYAHFVRSVFASYDVLFLGVSFTDAYLNELRSEILSFLYRGPRSEALRFPDPWGYAVVADPSRSWSRFLRQHEGIEALPYAAGQAHEGFDDILKGIADRTSAEAILRRHLGGEKVVWIDARGSDNHDGREVLESAGAHVIDACSPDEVRVDDLRDAALFLTNWTARSGRRPVPELLTERLRKNEIFVHAPIIVFAGEKHVERRRREAVRLGAWEYTTQWTELFNVLCRVFERVGAPTERRRGARAR